MNHPIARLVGASKTYGALTALRPLDLEIGHGVLGLIGPNGAGKTTMLRLLATALPPTTGQIVLVGHDITSSRAERVEARRHVGYLPQEVVFPRGMRAVDFLDYVAVLKEWRDRDRRHREVRRVLDLVRLGDRGSMRIRKLSGGQRRRLAIAQALIGQPDLLILDEPTTGLDPEQRAMLRQVISQLPGAVVVSTHQTEDVSALCDRVLVIDDGAIHFDGSVGELVATAVGQVHVGTEPTAGAVGSWRTGTGHVRSVGGRPGAADLPVDPSVEDAYLLLRNRTEERVR